MESIIMIVFGIALTPVEWLVKGLVVQQAFVWFIAPFFPNLAHLADAGPFFFMAIWTLVALITQPDLSDLEKKSADPDESALTSMFLAILKGLGRPLFALLILAIIRSWVIFPG